VSGVKSRIHQHLTRLGRVVPSPHQLVHKGNVLQDNVKFTNIPISNGDHCIFLFNLRDEKAEQTTVVQEPVKTEAVITVPPVAPVQQGTEGEMEGEGEEDLGDMGDGDLNDMGSDEDEEGYGDVDVVENILANIASWLPLQQQAEGQQPIPQQPVQQEPAQPPQHPVEQPQTEPEPQTPAQPPQPEQPAQGQPQQDQQQDQQQRQAAAAVRSIAQFLPLIPFPEQELHLLVSMGFPEWRCRKALLLNLFDPEMALDWILTHSGDADVDAPLNEAQMRQLLGAIQNIQEVEMEDDNSKVEEQIKEAIKNNKCTFTVTGKEYAHQKWYYCYTCGLVDTEGVCESCAAVCHKNHKLSPIRESTRFYCDCGAGASNCICNK